MTSLIKRIFYILVILAAVFFAGRVFVSQRSAPLELWHTFVPQEMSVQQIDAADWAQYLKHEAEVMESVRTQVTQKLDARAQTAGNRYFEGSPMHYGRLTHDWNRSFVLQPKGKPIGAVILLHGLTDSPYSIQRIAQEYTAHGFVAVGVRLPGHGTVPAGLVKAQWEDWMAATRLAAREAQKHIDATMPLHVVGYSNGGALAMKYALESIENKQLRGLPAWRASLRTSRRLRKPHGWVSCLNLIRSSTTPSRSMVHASRTGCRNHYKSKSSASRARKALQSCHRC